MEVGGIGVFPASASSYWYGMLLLLWKHDWASIEELSCLQICTKKKRLEMKHERDHLFLICECKVEFCPHRSLKKIDLLLTRNSIAGFWLRSVEQIFSPTLPHAIWQSGTHGARQRRAKALGPRARRDKGKMGFDTEIKERWVSTQT